MRVGKILPPPLNILPHSYMPTLSRFAPCPLFQGDCGTCESIVDGRKIRICKAIVPRNKTKVTIKTKFG